jgi:hypothetical protein
MKEIMDSTAKEKAVFFIPFLGFAYVLGFFESSIDCFHGRHVRCITLRYVCCPGSHQNQYAYLG